MKVNQVKEEPKDENVIYRNQDVIVLKGEAKDENKSS